MADGPQTPEELHSQIGEKLDSHHDEIQSAMNKAADKLNSIGDWSWLGGPLVGIGVGKLIDNFTSMCSKVWEAFKTACAKVWEIVGDAAGRPTNLAEIAGTYQNMRQKVEQMATDIQSQSNAVKNVWTGVSASAYTDIATAQSGAVMGVSQALSSAAALLAGAAESILHMWSDMLDHVVTGWIDASSALTGLGDLGNVVGAEVGPIVDAVLALVGAFWAAAKTYIDYITTQATTVTNGWNEIDGGVDGLPGFAWPGISASEADQYNSGDWHTAAGG